MSVTKNEQYIIHNITNADTLLGVSLLYNIDINIIKKVNNISSGDIWGFSYLKIPKIYENSEPKKISEYPEYYKNAKRSDDLQVLKQLTNEEDSVILTVYNHTNGNFNKTLNALEEIASLQKKCNLDKHTILAHYLVYSDKEENVFQLIEEKIVHSKNHFKMKTAKSKNFMQSQGLEEKNNITNKNVLHSSNTTCKSNNTADTPRNDFISVNKIKNLLLENTSQNISYVKNIIKKVLPIFKSDTKSDDDECKDKKGDESIESRECEFFTGSNWSSEKKKKKNDSAIFSKDETETPEEKNCANSYKYLIHKNTHSVLRKRM